jgi:hypothetical protein
VTPILRPARRLLLLLLLLLLLPLLQLLLLLACFGFSVSSAHPSCCWSNSLGTPPRRQSNQDCLG